MTQVTNLEELAKALGVNRKDETPQQRLAKTTEALQELDKAIDLLSQIKFLNFSLREDGAEEAYIKLMGVFQYWKLCGIETQKKYQEDIANADKPPVHEAATA